MLLPRLPRSTHIALLVALGVMLAAAGTVGATSARVDPRVLADTASGRTGNFLVVLRSQADTQVAAARAGSRAAQGRLVLQALRDAADTQGDIRAELRSLGARFRPYWIVNAIAVEGTRRVVDAMAARDDVLAIEPDRTFRAAADVAVGEASAQPAGVEWNVDKIGAPAVWHLGDTGQNVVYANADTGVAWEHAALKTHYRGWNGTSATHDYNWWDAVHGDLDGNGSNQCGFSSKVPCDDTSHGSHVLGTAIGDDGAGNQIGVAPGAKWIACRNMDNGSGRPSTYIECLQFFLAPTDENGKNPDPNKRPNVVGNSYTCPPSEGCSVSALQTAVDNMRSAGIFMSVSAGNGGRSGCATVVDPPALYDSSVTVGATDANDAIAVFSSRGPVLSDGSGRGKPDLVAPGVGVRSSVPGGGYQVFNGTSMASPHVGGAVLLLWSAFPDLRGNVDRTEQLLEQTAVKLTTTQGCGGDSASQIPNNTFGYGRVDVLAAYRAAEAESPPSLSIADVKVAEGNAGTKNAEFAVTLSRGSTQTVSVHYETKGGTAAAATDFRATAGTLTFASGETTKTISVAIVGDRKPEHDETFAVTLSASSNATIARGSATGTITNDDVDTTKPVVSSLSVDPASPRAGGAALVRYRLSEPALTTFTVKRGTRTVVRVTSKGTAGRNSFRLTLRHVPAADYRLIAVARDAAGNVGRPVAARLTVRT